jgi:fibronectin type 3 domain-containing protein
MLCLCQLNLLAQAPNLPTKGSLSETLFFTRTFTNANQEDTVIKPHTLPAAYTLELVGRVNSATGRGMDIEARNGLTKGFRLSLDTANLKYTAPLGNSTAWTASGAGQDYTIRIAVRNDSAHIYQNGAYIQSQPLSQIKDIAGGVEIDTVVNTGKGGSSLIPNWAGIAPGTYSGSPADYGWGYTGTASTTLFATANATTAGTSRYLDVSASSGSNLHTYLDSAYTGRLLYLRWDGSSISNTVYYYPVTVEANTTYDFSMLYAYVTNATGAKTITAGIGTTTDTGGRIASHVYTTSGTRVLNRESFVFTSQAAGTYYITITGDWGLFSIGELSLNKTAPATFIPNWAGMLPNNTGKPGDYGWILNPASSSLFAAANSTTAGTSRYLDVNTSSGSNLHTYNGSTYTGRILYVRWDGSYSSTVYSYPVKLEANTAYDFSLLYAYVSNGTAGSAITVGIGTTTAASGRLATQTLTTSTTARNLKKNDFIFTAPTSGTYYITFTGPAALYSIAELSVSRFAATPRFIFGKNYPTGAVDMQITAATYEEGAYAPAGIVTGATQNVTVTGTSASYLPTFNTSFTVPGKTDLHLTGDYAPLINSTVALNSNDAWLFFDNVPPATVTANWLSKVTINGVSAANNANVRVAIYKNGTAVIPNGNVTSQAALEVFTQPNLAGNTTAYETDTYHDSLAAFDNRIRSFRLHRGYMATMANNADGSGYSRVFIANDSDLIVNAMPQGLDTSVSFIRVFKWDWVSKKGKAGWDPNKLNCTWYYDWNIAGSSSANYNYVAIRQNGGWPSWSSINSKTGVNHLSGFNEPDQSDQSNLTVDQAVSYWPDFMQSGFRIGSPAPANPESSWITNFLAKTDSLNYRVDYVAIHCYWGGQTPSQWYSRLKAIYDRVKRPLWITEWNNGANWTTETWPTDTTLALQKQLSDIKGILQVLDTASFVERYAEYDWVQYKRSLVLADTLTPAGKYYAANKSNFAYNPNKAFVHTWKLIGPPLSNTINSDDYFTTTLTFKDMNGETGSKYVLERSIDGRDTGFTAINTFTGYTIGSTISFIDSVFDKATYRIKAYAMDGVTYAYGRSLAITRDAAPVAPTSFTGSVLSATQDSLQWNAGSNARSYNLKRSLSASGPFTTIAPRLTQLQYMDTALSPSTTYYYVVSSLNSAGESANSTVLQLTTNALVTPASVLNPNAASGDNQVALTWDFQYDAKYEIARASNTGGPYSIIATNVNAIRYEDTTVSNGTTYYYKIVAFNDAGRSPETAVLSATPAAGQHLYIGFDETAGTFARDAWGGYHGTLGATATHTTGYSAGAVKLNGTSTSYVSLRAGLLAPLNDFTISTWVRMDSLATWMRIFDFGTGTSQYMFLTPQASVSGSASTVRFAIKNGGAEQQVNYAYTWTLNAWTHLAIKRLHDTVSLYINGNLVASGTGMTINPSDLGNTGLNYIGKSQFADPVLNAAVDEFRIYNYALSDQNISNLANNQPLARKTVTSLPAEVAANQSDNRVTLYPNPVQHQLVVQLNGPNTGATVYVYDATGVLVLSKTLVGNTTYLPMGNMSAGMYYIQVVNGQQHFIKKVVKE